MKKKILFIAGIIVTIMLSIGAISANESVTDSHTTKSVDDTSDVSVHTNKIAGSSYSESNDGNAKTNVDDTSKVSLSSKKSLKSENSNNLSTETLSNKNSGKNTKKLSVKATIKSKNIIKYYKGNTKYTANFLNSKGKPLANKNVKITVNGKTYTVKTNKKGIVNLDINLKPDTYKVTAKNPVTGYSLTNTFKILTTISANDVVKVYKDNKRFYATFLNNKGKALYKKYIKFKIAGKTHKVKTNYKGIASLSLNNIKTGTYKIISYNTDGLTKNNIITILATPNTKIITKSYTYLTNNTKTIRAKLVNSLDYGINGKTIKFTVNGKTYHATTNSNGIATIKLDKISKGIYNILYNFYNNGIYKASNTSNKLMVLNNNNAKYTIKSGTTFIEGTKTPFKVALTASDIALAERTITLKINNHSYVKTTDKEGIVSLPINLKKGDYVISYSYNGESKIKPITESTTITVKELSNNTKLVSINNIINSAVELKKYYDNNKKLPNTITSGNHIFTLPEFLYLMSKALYQLGESNMANINSISGVGEAPSPFGNNINSKELFKADYLLLANNTAKFIETNKRAPNYVSTTLGKIIYSEIVDALSRGLNFYKENNRLPNYLIISYNNGGTTGTKGTGLNCYENLTDSQILSYLKSTTNCQVNSTSISNIVSSVTNGLTTDYAKAKAIFEYVRDKVTYSFYFNTKYGAVNTLSYKKGNCVDHAHLVIAMCRTAGIAARYVHGVCTFSSGSTYGHVWAQVYVGGQWIVADGTSSRNTFGNIVNWNTKSFTLKNIYTSLPF